MSSAISFEDITAAAARIADDIQVTPFAPSAVLSERLGADVVLKLEHQQTTGSFKLRGASNAVRRLDERARSAGVVAASTGNHGRGLAFAARKNGIRAVICMGSLVPRNKIDGIRAQGAEVRIVGNSQDQAQVEVDRLVAEEGMTMLPPFDHPDIIAGQGTLGLEIMRQCPGADTIVVPLSGGGLIAGVALAAKSIKPGIRVVGVTMERGAAMATSLDAGRPVEVEELPTLADSLGGGIGQDNRYTFGMVGALVDDVLLVSEQAIAGAIRHAYFEEQQIVEGSGSVGIAAALSGLLPSAGTTVLVLSGRNIDMKLHRRIINDQWSEPELETVDA